MSTLVGTVEGFFHRSRQPGRQFVRDGRLVRFTGTLDESTLRFEDDLCLRIRSIGGAADAEDDKDADRGGVRGAETEEQALLREVSSGTLELPLHQRHAWLRNSRREFRLLQVTDTAGQPAAQAVVYIDRLRFLPMYGDAAVQRMGPAITGEEEGYCLQLLHDLCVESGDVLSLRLQPRRLLPCELRDFEGRARLAGYTLCEPFGVTRTLLVDLRLDPEEQLRRMSQKLRRKFRRRDKATQFEIRLLSEQRWAGACEAATQASVGRTGGPQRRRLEWQTMLTLAQDRPDLVRVVGLFIQDRPEELLAVASACRHGRLAEYLSAGSLDDPALRKEPFNYWLLWELFVWAREQGSMCIDLGGVTVGGPSDPLAGISRFKRHLTDLDVEVGREMMVVLRPYPGMLMSSMRALRERVFAA